MTYDPTLAGHAQPNAQEGLGGIALVAQILGGQRDVEEHCAQRVEQEVVVDLSRTLTRSPPGYARTTAPYCSSDQRVSQGRPSE